MVPNHAAAVHIPLALALVLPLVSLGVLLAIWRKVLPHAAWGVVVGLQLLLTVTGFVAEESGEHEEERVEAVVPHDAMELHEERGELFAKANIAVLVLVVLPLVLRRQGDGIRLGIEGVALVGMIVVAVLGYRTGHAGGELVYIHGAAQPYVDEAKGAAKPAAKPAVPQGEPHVD